jgi:hypothetical protein
LRSHQAWCSLTYLIYLGGDRMADVTIWNWYSTLWEQSFASKSKKDHFETSRSKVVWQQPKKRSDQNSGFEVLQISPKYHKSHNFSVLAFERETVSMTENLSYSGAWQTAHIIGKILFKMLYLELFQNWKIVKLSPSGQKLGSWKLTLLVETEYLFLDLFLNSLKGNSPSKHRPQFTHY